MAEQHYKKLSFEFPAEEYAYLKMLCAKKDVTIKHLVSEMIFKALEQYENEMDLAKIQNELTEDNINNAIPWDDVEKMLGWDKL